MPTATPHPQPPATLRQRRRDELARQIQRTALNLFAERGFDQVTTEDIAAAVGISTSTFFRYVPTKETLLTGPIDQTFAELNNRLRARPAHETAIEALMAILPEHAAAYTPARIGTWATAVQHNREILQRLPGLATAHRTELITLIAERMHTNPKHDPRPALLAHTVVSTGLYALRQWLTTQPTTALHTHIHNTLRTVLHATWNHSHTPPAAAQTPTPGYGEHDPQP